MATGKRIGMYGETPSVKIGKYTICRQDPDGDDKSVWVQHEDGEGSEFKDEVIEAALHEFYEKNF